jgi:hypothetical protein
MSIGHGPVPSDRNPQAWQSDPGYRPKIDKTALLDKSNRIVTRAQAPFWEQAKCLCLIGFDSVRTDGIHGDTLVKVNNISLKIIPPQAFSGRETAQDQPAGDAKITLPVKEK